MSRLKSWSAVVAALCLSVAGEALAAQREPVASQTSRTVVTSAQPALETGTPSAHQPMATSDGKMHLRTHRLDLNAATREELAKLPGLDQAMADKIIAARPFKTKADLVSKKLVSEIEYKQLMSHVMVKGEMAKGALAKNSK